VLYALAKWGPEALARFNGMFALAFYDTRDGTLLLARDYAGVKPLYYAVRPAGLIFASQYDQILTHPWLANAEVSPEALAIYLRLGHIPAPYAMLRDTFALEPGTWLEMDGRGGVHSGRYFEFPMNSEPDIANDDAAEAVDAAVTNAVRRQMVSDTPVGCFLSGGIDSPLIAAKIAQTIGSVPTFTIGSDSKKLDESSDAARYAATLGHPNFLQHLTPQGALELVGEAIAACSEPLADVSILPTLFLSRLAASQVKVVLSGDGGDELFWGYAGRFISALQRVRHFQTGGLWSSLRCRAQRIQSQLLKTKPRFSTIGEWYRNKHSRFREPWLSRVFPELPAWPTNLRQFEFHSESVDATAHWLRWNEFVVHLPMVLSKVDRASMHHSLEVRVPLLDLEVVQTAARIDWKSCLAIERERGKLPLRHALRKHLDFQTEEKKGFTVPLKAWLRGPFRQELADRLLGLDNLLGQPICRQTVQTMIQEHKTGQADHSKALWTLLVLVLWSERHYTPRGSGEQGAGSGGCYGGSVRP
jgi:asparagine synthase (glutamine-hydrolysing)